MSSEALAHVLRYSTHNGATYTVLLCIADSVNDQYNYELWTSAGYLSRKARTTRETAARALSVLENDGWLSRIDSQPGKTVKYRFIMDDSRPVVFESRTRDQKSQGCDDISQVGVTTEHNTCDETSHKPNRTPNPKPKKEPNLLDFDEFYAAYPRHEAPATARKAWAKAIAKVDPAVLVKCAVEYRQWCERENKERRFIPLPATWLNGERWEDERPEPAQKPDRMQAHLAHIQELWENEHVDNPQQLEG